MTPPPEPNSVPADDAGQFSSTLLTLLGQIARELRPNMRSRALPTLDASLEHDLGLDSLARVELLHRIERAFGIRLPESALATAETPRDLLREIRAARRAPSGAPGEASVLPEMPGTVRAPQTAGTLIEALRWHVERVPDRLHVVFEDSAGEAHPMSYTELWQRSLSVAGTLRGFGVDSGETVAIMLGTSLEYFPVFFGILLAGAVPVPIYPPARLTQIEDHFLRNAGILANARVCALITVPEAKSLIRLLTTRVETLRHLLTSDEMPDSSAGATPSAARPSDTAFLQYTSGSTGNPKGVILSHANLLANLRAMGEAAQVGGSDVFVSWLPLYHDMGLIGAWLGSLYFGYPLVVMSPLTFLARPERWLRAIHRHRGTLSAAPNFAYELCLHKIEEGDLAGVDLASWRWAFNGAEPVGAATMRAFASRFRPYGLRAEALAPVYGLAENAVGLAFPPPQRGLRVDRVRRKAFTRTRRAEPAAETDLEAMEFVACGRPLPGHEIRVVDALGRELGEREEGRVEFKGPSATRGYFDRPDETARLFHGEWLDSGDLAYVSEGEIYLTGRTKDIIIRGGRHFYPYELEDAVGRIAGVRRGCVAVFGTEDARLATQRLVVLAETRETDPATRERLQDEIATRAIELLGAPADEIVLVRPHSVLKTSSGKIRRAATRERYEQGVRGVAPPPVWWQIVRLAWADAAPLMRRTMRAAGELAYAGYAWLLFGLLAPMAWGLAVALPRPVWSWRVSAWVARLFFLLAGVPITVEGKPNLAGGAPVILVANHASYLDGLVLVATLPRPFCFVAKRELGEQVLAGTYLRHIGAVFVERFDAGQSVEAASRLIELARQGRPLAFFPEGTFTRIAGLGPFHLGAFEAAAQAALPVVPVTLVGTRALLRGDQWFPRRGAVRVVIGTPVAPSGKDWGAALRLRDAARAAILARCAAPDLTT